MNRIEICDVFSVPAYFQAVSEEGERYEYQRGFNVIVYAMDPEHPRVRDTFLYTGRNCEAAICFEGESFLQETLNAIRGKGSINPVFWTHINSENLDALPDYVTNPHRPEYN